MTTRNTRIALDLKVRQIAEQLSVHPETVRRLARSGAFPGASKIGPKHCAQISIPRADVEAYRAKQPKVCR